MTSETLLEAVANLHAAAVAEQRGRKALAQRLLEDAAELARNALFESAGSVQALVALDVYMRCRAFCGCVK